MKATFISPRKNPGERARLICRETNGTYVITKAPFGFNIFCNGWKIAERSNMCHALALVQRDAEIAVRSSCHA